MWGQLKHLWLTLFPPRDLGRRGEAVAARYLRQRGLRILARNWRVRSGEIDIVALEADTLVFVEVKARRQRGDRGQREERGDPLDRIDPAKARRIRSAARSFRRRLRGGYDRCRLDGVVVEFGPERAWGRASATVRWYPALHPLDDLDGP